MILGEDREATGVLLSIDGEDGIVRMDLDEQLKILNLRFLEAPGGLRQAEWTLADNLADGDILFPSLVLWLCLGIQGGE